MIPFIGSESPHYVGTIWYLAQAMITILFVGGQRPHYFGTIWYLAQAMTIIPSIGGQSPHCFGTWTIRDLCHKFAGKVLSRNRMLRSLP